MAKSNVERMLAAAGTIQNPDVEIPVNHKTARDIQIPRVLVDGRALSGKPAKNSTSCLTERPNTDGREHFSMGITVDMATDRGLAESFRIALPDSTGRRWLFEIPCDGGIISAFTVEPVGTFTV